MATGELATAAQPVPAISDIDVQITTAKTYKRDIKSCIARIREQIFADEETTRACWYSKPVGKKKDEQTGTWEMKFADGPSIRFAEIAAAAWGNLHSACRQEPYTGTQVIGKAVVWDLESNNRHEEEVRKSIVTKAGKQYSPSDIANAGLGAQSIALRNCVMRVIGRGQLKSIADDVESVVKQKLGKLDSTKIRQKIDNALSYFAEKQIDEKALCWLLGVESREVIKVSDLMQAGRIKTSLDEGSSDAAELLTDYYAELKADAASELDDPDAAMDKAVAADSTEF